MNSQDVHYCRYALVREMLDAPDIIRNFEVNRPRLIAHAVILKHRLLFTGEGSSRIFPAKNAIYQANRRGLAYNMITDGGRQAMEYDLRDRVVVAASNSGQTKEIVALIRKLKAEGAEHVYGVSAHDHTPVIELARQGFVLQCGAEQAVAATKSIVEEALFLLAIIENLLPAGMPERLPMLAEAFAQTLHLPIDPGIIQTLVTAPQIYFAGRNNGVAEELTLKANEITRKKADFLEGTYAIHGIEEVMEPAEALVLIEPFEEDLEKFQDVLLKGVGIHIIAIATRATGFPTIVIPEVEGLNEFIQLACGWNMLVETGIAEGVDIDKPIRARKVGNIA